MFSEINTAQLAVLDQVIVKYYSGYDKEHAEQVTQLALKLYDLLAPSLSWPASGHNLLYCSAMLHDIGHYINMKRHDRHTYYIILNEGLLSGWPEKWRLLTALVAGSHRKKVHSSLDELAVDEQDMVMRLISILRIADALDFYHGQNMDIVRVEIERDQIGIHISGPEYADLLPRLQSKGQLLKKTTGRKVEFAQIPG